MKNASTTTDRAARRRALRSIAPKLADVTEDVLFGDVWERKGLSKRDRSIATIALLVASNCPDQLAFHMKRGIENGLTVEELGELVTHLAFYAGWPLAINAAYVAHDVSQQHAADPAAS